MNFSINSQVLPLILLIGLSFPNVILSKDNDSLQETNRNLRGIAAPTHFDSPHDIFPPTTEGSSRQLGQFENKAEPTWLANGPSARFESASSDIRLHLGTGPEPEKLYKSHKIWRKQKFPLKVGKGTKKVFDDGVIADISFKGGSGGDTTTLMINPHLMCQQKEPDLEAGLTVVAESMVESGDFKFNVYMDMKDVSISDFGPSCMQKFEGLYQGMLPSGYPLRLNKMVAHPVPPTMTSMAGVLLDFAGKDPLVRGVVVGTDDSSRVADELGFPHDEVKAAGGTRSYIKIHKRNVEVAEI